MIQSTTFAALAIAALVYVAVPAAASAPVAGSAPIQIRDTQVHDASLVQNLVQKGVPEDPTYVGSASAFAADSQLSQAASLDSEPPPFATRKSKIKVEEVQFKTRDKLTLTADFYPSRNKGRAPAAMLIHDAGADRSGLQKVAIALQKRGFAVLAIDLRGHGESISEGWDWSKRVNEEGRVKLWSLAMRDLEAATKYLREDRKDVHNANLSLVGVGAGAALAVRYALNDLSVRAVVLINPQIEAYGYNMYKDVVGLQGLPTLVMIPSKRRDEAARMQNQAHKHNDGLQYVVIKAVKPDRKGDPLADRGLPNAIRSFLQAEAMPKR